MIRRENEVRNDVHLQEKLTELRKVKRKTYREIEKDTGIDDVKLWRYETGKQAYVDIEVIKKLEEYYGEKILLCDPDEKDSIKELMDYINEIEMKNRCLRSLLIQQTEIINKLTVVVDNSCPDEDDNTWGYISVDMLLKFCQNSTTGSISPNEFMRMHRVKIPD